MQSKPNSFVDWKQDALSFIYGLFYDKFFLLNPIMFDFRFYFLLLFLLFVKKNPFELANHRTSKRIEMGNGKREGKIG